MYSQRASYLRHATSRGKKDIASLTKGGAKVIEMLYIQQTRNSLLLSPPCKKHQPIACRYDTQNNERRDRLTRVQFRTQSMSFLEKRSIDVRRHAITRCRWPSSAGRVDHCRPVPVGQRRLVGLPSRPASAFPCRGSSGLVVAAGHGCDAPVCYGRALQNT